MFDPWFRGLIGEIALLLVPVRRIFSDRTFINISVFCIFLMSSYPLNAQNHLEPEDGTLAGYDFELEYHVILRRRLLQDLNPDYAARMICLASFSPEWVVSLQQDENRAQWTIELRIAEKQLWGASRPDDIRIIKKHTVINARTASRVRHLWLTTLRGVEYPRGAHEGGVDGITYHFSSSMPPDMILAGQCWSPIEKPQTNSLNNKLVNVGNLMRQLVEAAPERRDEVGQIIERKVQELQNEIDK